MLLTYLNDYNSESESAKRYHQWCYIGMLSSLLGRNTWLRFGKGNMYVNSYIMLIGAAAARKSSAVNAAVSLLELSGYDTIARGRTSKEKFLLDLSGHIDDTGGKHNPDIVQKQGTETTLLFQNLFDADITELADEDIPHEMLIAADEFTNFVGAGNYEFISLLGELWDNPKFYDNRVKNSKSFRINQPCVNILAGNTPTGFAAAFPPEMLGQGFVSRLILVYGERTNVRNVWPEPPNVSITQELAEHLVRVRTTVLGEITCSRQGEAFEALDWLYKNWPALEDIRFANYSGRRFTHLLKLCAIFAANALRNEIVIEDVIAANTLLTITEDEMPLALGEFGKSKNSDVANKVLDFLNAASMPQNINAIWQKVRTDLDSKARLVEIITGLCSAEKVQNVKGGFLPIKKQARETGKYFDLTLIGGR